jgi:hypothetical protein
VNVRLCPTLAAVTHLALAPGASSGIVTSVPSCSGAAEANPDVRTNTSPAALGLPLVFDTNTSNMPLVSGVNTPNRSAPVALLDARVAPVELRTTTEVAPPVVFHADTTVSEPVDA